VKGIGGDQNLGGEVFDKEILNYALDRFKSTSDHDIKAMEKSKKKALRRIRYMCERVKVVLSTAEQAELVIDAIVEGDDLNENITRAKFEELCAHHFDKTLSIVDAVLKDAGLMKTDVDDIVLVGGSTRIPKL
jgi:molecular chaperone DnaK (HSP70)